MIFTESYGRKMNQIRIRSGTAQNADQLPARLAVVRNSDKPSGSLVVSNGKARRLIPTGHHRM